MENEVSMHSTTSLSALMQRRKKLSNIMVVKSNAYSYGAYFAIIYGTAILKSNSCLTWFLYYCISVVLSSL